MPETIRSSPVSSAPMLNEELLDSLVPRVAHGDPEALSALYASYAATMHRVAYRLTLSADDADDVVQDVFIGLPEALNRYVDHGAFGAWLRTVTVRVALMRMRASRTRDRVATHAVQPAMDNRDATDRISLTDALARLSVEHRTVLTLKVMEGYSHAEIAEMLGIRRGTSEVRLFRALRELRVILGENKA